MNRILMNQKIGFDTSEVVVYGVGLQDSIDLGGAMLIVVLRCGRADIDLAKKRLLAG